MTSQHLAELLSAAEAKKDDRGWTSTKEGQNLTLYVANHGVSLTVGRVASVKLEGDLLKARTVKGELYVLVLEDIFAGAVEASVGQSRKAGFV